MARTGRPGSGPDGGLRKMRGKRTLEDVSKRTSIAVGHLSEIERGKARPSRDSAERLAREYGTDTERILLLSRIIITARGRQC